MEPRAQLLIYGGFCYFDRAFSIVGLVALTGQGEGRASHRSEALTFEGPYPLYKQTAHKLHTLGRLQNVTLSFLYNMGARSSGWVNPDEFGLCVH
jgi:hypothetical protein